MHNKKFTVVIEYEPCTKEESEMATGSPNAIGFRVNNICCYKNKELPFESLVMMLGTLKATTHDLLLEAMKRKLSFEVDGVLKVKITDIPEAILARDVFDDTYKRTIGETEPFLIDRESVDGSER